MKFKGLSSNVLKIIACFCMVIDHITYLFIPQYDPNGWMDVSIPYLIGRCIGRSSFVIFSYLVVEGFFKTKNLRKHILVMAGAALITEPAFDFMYGRLNGNSFYILQNILFSFTIATIAMYFLEKVKKKYFLISAVKYNIFSVLICIAAFAVEYVIRIDYGVVGIALLLIFYFFRDMKRKYLVFVLILWTMGCMYMEYMLEWAGLLALIPIFMYNGERGKLKMKWFFYAFYPLHLLLLGILRWVVWK